ncbi:MAG: hypothetical protein H5T84_02380 [Thermoleophilia bacterium]|nr:hypothetical protein [Thermoleophilia bacterium]
MLNLPQVIKATRLLVDPHGARLSPRRITLSTVGLVPGIRELASYDPRPKLAVSLNATTQEQRLQLMPIARKYPLLELLRACREYPLRPWERLTFEYVLMAGVNDSEADARRLVSLLGALRCKVNLIPLNPGPGIPYRPPSEEALLSFQRIVARSIPCFIRRSRGADIFAACGQLRRMAALEAAPVEGG